MKKTLLCWFILVDSSVQSTNNNHPAERQLRTTNRPKQISRTPQEQSVISLQSSFFFFPFKFSYALGSYKDNALAQPPPSHFTALSVISAVLCTSVQIESGMNSASRMGVYTPFLFEFEKTSHKRDKSRQGRGKFRYRTIE